ncbi:MAG TPA: hypothetical protein VK502_03355 [Candidatus Saccharimonadales bacterium]|nr:hypothetical protein [Candidatus Saccharimonadales bacterium]
MSRKMYNPKICEAATRAVFSGERPLAELWELSNQEKAWVFVGLMWARPDDYLFAGDGLRYPLVRIIRAMFNTPGSTGKHYTIATNVITIAYTHKLYEVNSDKRARQILTPPRSLQTLVEKMKEQEAVTALHERTMSQLGD